MTAPATVEQAEQWHPEWCELGHHCTAVDGGEHAGAPLVWEVATGRVVVSRHLGADGRAWVEVRHVLQLPARDERHTQRLIRVLVAVSCALLREVVRWRV